MNPQLDESRTDFASKAIISKIMSDHDEKIEKDYFTVVELKFYSELNEGNKLRKNNSKRFVHRPLIQSFT